MSESTSEGVGVGPVGGVDVVGASVGASVGMSVGASVGATEQATAPSASGADVDENGGTRAACGTGTITTRTNNTIRP